MDGLLTKPLAVEALEDVLERYGLGVGDTSSLDATVVAEIITTIPEALPIDVDQLRELAGDDIEFIRSIAEAFASSSTGLLAQLRAAAASGDAVALAKAAHALKGASANLFAENLREAASEMEARGGKLTRAELDTRIAGIARESERVSAALHALATGSAASAVG
jgi:HPt (histidine-containing phosphotransfer) domain-containing protein